jgi:hypothetical protein
MQVEDFRPFLNVIIPANKMTFFSCETGFMGHSGHQSLSQCGFTQRGFYYTRLKIIKYMGEKICRALKIFNTRVSTQAVTHYTAVNAGSVSYPSTV